MIDLASATAFCETHCLTYRTSKQKWKEGSGRSRTFSLILDSLIGVLILSWIYEHPPIQFWPVVDSLIGELDRLITWLTNNPAGLKLNEPLNLFLAKFFHYHIYLWQAFIMVSRVLPLGSALMFSLILGFSLSVALFADFCALITLHIFCFEVYANRLGRVSWRALVASWRLLRGKKWNPLRERVDAVTLDSRELFVSTCLFIILLFVILTVAVYFVVFTALAQFIRCLMIGLDHLSRIHLYTMKAIDG